jgi:hypothetical protein
MGGCKRRIALVAKPPREEEALNTRVIPLARPRSRFNVQLFERAGNFRNRMSRGLMLGRISQKFFLWKRQIRTSSYVDPSECCQISDVA